ncbi:MAG: ATP-binding protein [Jatrophihabitantaceae bacterium]
MRLPRGHQDRLVGRDREVAALDALIDGARAGTGGALLIEGAAGLGKSGLLAVAAERARVHGVQIVAARAVAGERDYPYGVVLHLFGRALGAEGSARRRGHFAGAAELVEPLFAGRYVESDTRSTFALLHGLFWLTVNLAQGTPLLLCVDDVQSADDGTLSFLQYLVTRVDDLAVAVLIAARPAVPAEGSGPLADIRSELATRRVRLTPLLLGAVSEIVRAEIPEADAELCAVCAEVTRGNPFYIREVLLALGDEVPAPAADLSHRLRDIGFATVSRAALVRLGRLGPDAIALARALAVFGDGTPLRRAATLARLQFDVAARAAEVLAGEEIVRLGRTLDFGHPLIGQSIADELPPLQRSQAHLRAARLLGEEGAAVSLVASHLLQAPATGDQWVVSVLRESAQQARIRGLADVAVRELQRALEEPPDRASRPTVLAELGSAELAAGLPVAVEHLSAAAAVQTGPARVEVLRTLARALSREGRRMEAARVLERALDDGARSEADLEYELLSDYLVNALFETDLRQRAIERTTRLTPDAPAGSTPAERALLSALAIRSAQDAEDAARSVELARRAWSDGALLADQGVDGPGWLMVVWTLQLADDFAGAEQVASAVMAETRRAGSIDAFATASYTHGRVQFDLGSLVEAQADAQQAIDAGRSGWSRFQGAAYALNALVLIERDEPALAQATLDEAAEAGSASGIERPWLQFSLGRLQLARHQPAEALASFTAAGEWLTSRLSVEHTALPWRDYAARAAVAVGEPALAHSLAEPLVALGERAGLPVVHARGLRALAMADGAGGVARLRAACDLLATSAAALEHTEAQIALGAWLRRGGDRASARKPLAEALDRAVRIGATRQARHARDELAAAGGRPRRETRTGPSALTPSERRVGRLATDGLSNSQIAQALFVTPKTVEYHLRHVYQKLGITGRAGLAAALADS